jgi:hypothetical protein
VKLGREDAERVALAGGEPARELVLGLFDEVGEQGERLERLERAAGQSSQDRSMLPSKDPPSAPRRPARRRSGRMQGGQPGHEGASRTLVVDPDETLPVRP